MSRALKRKTTIEYGKPSAGTDMPRYKKARYSAGRNRSMASSRSSSRFQRISTIEEKWIGFNWGGTTAYVNNSDALTLLNGIQQGTTNSSMIGKKCILKLLNFTYQVITPPLVSASLGTYKNIPVRVMFVYDKSNNGTTPAVTDILAAHSVNSLRNLDNTDRFVMLYDQIHETGINTAVTGSTTYTVCGGNLSTVVRKTIKMNLPLDGPSTVGGVAGINSGAIFYIAIQDNAAVSSGSYISGTGRIRFTDA